MSLWLKVNLESMLIKFLLFFRKQKEDIKEEENPSRGSNDSPKEKNDQSNIENNSNKDAQSNNENNVNENSNNENNNSDQQLQENLDEAIGKEMQSKEQS